MVDIAGPKEPDPQLFRMIRVQDDSGISGTGKVAEGVVMSNGKCIILWSSHTPAVHVWDSFKAFKAVHIDSHPDNNTIIEWLVGGSWSDRNE